MGGQRETLFCIWFRIFRWLLKLLSQLSMKPIQFTVEQGAFCRSGIVARRSTKSQRISRSHLLSRVKKTTERSVENAEHIDIYFDKGKRKTYLKSVIDHYFIPQDHQTQFLHENQPNITLAPPLLTRNSKSSESSRPKTTKNISISRLKLKSKLSLMDFSMPEMSSLPVIEQGLNRQKRPSSVHQPSSFLSIEKSNLIEKEKDLEESLFFESNPSLMENSQIESKESFKYVNIRKAGKLLGRSKVYNSPDNQHLHRENSAKKIGIQVLWTPTADNSLEFPNYKTLRQLCYSIVEDRNGEQPVSLIYPTAYYNTLFVNQCQELVDIVVSLVKTVAKGKGMVANNQIHMKNVVKKRQKQFVLTDWGCAAIRQGFTVQGRTFNKDLGALCRQGNKWIVSPQYLAPEMLKAAQSGFYDHLWTQKGGVGSCDVWSIGCLILELITLVPLNSQYYCMVKGRDRKRGALGVKVKTADRILAKLRGFKNYAVRSIKQQMRMRKDLKINEKLLQLLPRMLEESVDNRVSADEILMKLA